MPQTTWPCRTSDLDAVLRALLARPDEPIFGLDLARTANVGWAEMFAALAALSEAAWLTSDVGEFDTIVHHFRLTPLGLEEGPKLLGDPAG